MCCFRFTARSSNSTEQRIYVHEELVAMLQVPQTDSFFISLAISFVKRGRTVNSWETCLYSVGWEKSFRKMSAPYSGVISRNKKTAITHWTFYAKKSINRAQAMQLWFKHHEILSSKNSLYSNLMETGVTILCKTGKNKIKKKLFSFLF